jgi:hypothetical protein
MQQAISTTRWRDEPIILGDYDDLGAPLSRSRARLASASSSSAGSSPRTTSRASDALSTNGESRTSDAISASMLVCSPRSTGP